MEKDIINNTTLKTITKQTVWFTADLHMGHRNLVRCLTSWEDKDPCRDFPSVEEMDKSIIDNINSVVKADDILYILGDFAITHLRKWPHYRNSINCHNVHLILGNHDPKRELLKLDKPLYPGATVTPGKLFTTIKHVDEINVKIDAETEQRISLSHYSHRTWNRAHHGAWMLYGHSHGSMPQYEGMPFQKKAINWLLRKFKLDKFQYPMLDEYKYKTIDVGIDTNKYMPYSLEQLQQMFKNRRNLGIDHHKTN